MEGVQPLSMRTGTGQCKATEKPVQKDFLLHRLFLLLVSLHPFGYLAYLQLTRSFSGSNMPSGFFLNNQACKS